MQYTVALGSVGFYWEEHIFVTINQYGRMAVWLNRGSGFKEVRAPLLPSAGRLAGGWRAIGCRWDRSCASPAGGQPS